MTRATRLGLLLALAHLLIVVGVYARYVTDRQTLPRVWARAAPVDPNLPIRGRYVRLRIEAAIAADFITSNVRAFSLSATDDGQLVAMPDDTGVPATVAVRDGVDVARLDEPMAFFIPEHAADPSQRPPGEELWVEVSIPGRGAPRPIQLGVRTNGGAVRPLTIR